VTNNPPADPVNDEPSSDPGAKNGRGLDCTRSWLRPILPIALIALCAEMGTSVLNNSTLPLYFTEGLGIGKDILALIIIPFYIAEVIFKVPLGVLADKFGRKPVMLCGCLMTVFTPLLLMSIRVHPGGIALGTLICFGFLRLLDGGGGAALWPPLFAYVGVEVPVNNRGAAMGLLNLMYIIGIAFSFYLGGKLDDDFDPFLTGQRTLGGQMQLVGHHVHEMVRRLSHHGQQVATAASPAHLDLLKAAMSHRSHYFPSMYFAVFLFGLASIACLLGLRNKRPSPGASTHQESEGVTWESFKSALHKIPQFLGLAFVTFYGIGCIANLVKIFAVEEFHMTEQHFGLLMLRTALVIAVLAYPLGHMSDRWGKPFSVRLGFGLCAVGLWGIPILHGMHQVHEIAFVISAAIMGVGFVIAFPAWNALLTSLSDESHRATVFSAVSTCQGIGVLVGILTGGFLYQHTAHIAPFATSAALVTVGAVLAMIFIRDSRLKLHL
jgi:DHA1 family multidrug resistance protein-like MFS transporter